MQTDPPPPPPPANLTSLFAAAQNASGAASMAEEDATAAQKSATDSAKMLSTAEVGGQSMKAMMSAQAILKAMADAAQAVMDAETALAAADKAKTDAAAIADDHPQKAALMQAIDDAIKDAQDAVAATKKVRDGTAIKNAVTEVQGANKKGTPRSVATAVGKNIAAALAVGGQNTGTRITFADSAPATSGDSAVDAALRYLTDDHQGMTWAEIVGEANVMMKRLGQDNANIPVASIAGMTAADVAPDGTNLGTTNNDDGNSTPSSNYKAIPGTVWCLGGTDGCKVTDGKLGAGWYFSPTSPKAYYQNKTDDSTTPADESLEYEAETLYASYGHWLSVSGTDWTVHSFATSGATTGADVSTVGDDTNNLANSATYSGKAAGMSVRKTGSGDSQTVDSGRFTANVSLSAKFGATPTVSGTINNFVGDAVGSGWSVALGSATLAAGSFNSSTATASGRDGTWRAQAYGGDTSKRPAGIFGNFTAHFTDGDATGAYATRN